LKHYASFRGKWEIRKCQECGFGQSNVTADDIKCFYESDYFAGLTGKFSQDQDDRIDEGRKWWVDTFIPGSEINCLEVGPGSTATIAKYLQQSRPGIKYEAIEVSTFASEKLRGAGLSVYTGRLYDEDIRRAVNGQFDCLFATEVIEHDLDPQRFADGVFNALKSGGRACLTTGNFNGLTARYKGASWYYLYPPAHVCFYTPRSATILFKQAGFRNVEVHCVGLNYVRFNQKYRIPGFLQFAHMLQISTGMTISVQK
jgi:SAM-dependent methyltransferase